MTATCMLVARRHLRIATLMACAAITASCSTAKSWHCDAPAGTYSDHDWDVPETTVELTGEIVFNKVHDTTEWHPLAKVGLTDRAADPGSCHCDGVEAEWYANDPDFLTINMTADGKKIPLGRVPYDKPVTYKLTYSRLGELKLEVGTGVVTSVWPAAKHNTLTVDCSSADVDFRNMQLK